MPDSRTPHRELRVPRKPLLEVKKQALKYRITLSDKHT
jgi:hypothetical protein